MNDENKMQEFFENMNTLNNGYRIKNIKKYLFKFYLCLFFKFLLIDGLFFLACYFKFNELIYSDSSYTLGAFIPSIILLFFLFCCKCCWINENRENKKSIFVIILFFIVILSLLLILLSHYIDYMYITYVLSLACLDMLVYTIFYSFCYVNRGIVPFIIGLIIKFNGLYLIYFFFYDQSDLTVLIIIGSISLCIDFYITSFRIGVNELYNDGDYLYMVLDFNMRIFAPIALIVLVAMFIVIYVAFLAIIYALSILMNIVRILFVKDEDEKEE